MVVAKKHYTLQDTDDGLIAKIGPGLKLRVFDHCVFAMPILMFGSPIPLGFYYWGWERMLGDDIDILYISLGIGGAFALLWFLMAREMPRRVATLTIDAEECRIRGDTLDSKVTREFVTEVRCAPGNQPISILNGKIGHRITFGSRLPYVERRELAQRLADYLEVPLKIGKLSNGQYY